MNDKKTEEKIEKKITASQRNRLEKMRKRNNSDRDKVAEFNHRWNLIVDEIVRPSLFINSLCFWFFLSITVWFISDLQFVIDYPISYIVVFAVYKLFYAFIIRVCLLQYLYNEDGWCSVVRVLIANHGEQFCREHVKKYDFWASLSCAYIIDFIMLELEEDDT